MTLGYYDKENQKVVVELPMSLVAFAQENHPNFPLCITDIDAAGKFLAEHIQEFGEDPDTGDITFTLLIDEIFETAYEIGKEWIETN